MKFVAHKTEHAVPPIRVDAPAPAESARGGYRSWKDKDHPELKQGAAKWVRKIRQETERRFQNNRTRAACRPDF